MKQIYLFATLNAVSFTPSPTQRPEEAQHQSCPGRVGRWGGCRHRRLESLLVSRRHRQQEDENRRYANAWVCVDGVQWKHLEITIATGRNFFWSNSLTANATLRKSFEISNVFTLAWGGLSDVSVTEAKYRKSLMEILHLRWVHFQLKILHYDWTKDEMEYFWTSNHREKKITTTLETRLRFKNKKQNKT